MYFTDFYRKFLASFHSEMTFVTFSRRSEKSLRKKLGLSFLAASSACKAPIDSYSFGYAIGHRNPSISGWACSRWTLALTFFVTGLFSPWVQISAETINPPADSSNNAREMLIHRLEMLTSLQGKFRQTLSSKGGELVQSTTGTFALKRPGYYYWKSDEPYPQTVMGNGSKVWIYDPDLEQVTIASEEASPYNPASLMSGGVDNLAARYHVVLVNETQMIKDSKGPNPVVPENPPILSGKLAAVEKFELRPRQDNDSPFEYLSLTFKAQQLIEAGLVDRLGQVTSIAFTDTESNVTLEDSTFTFVPPEGTDILMNE
jgi:outer membrane lipoprotein carrier protein